MAHNNALMTFQDGADLEPTDRPIENLFAWLILRLEHPNLSAYEMHCFSRVAWAFEI